jgi:CheY-like chemotaxis protein
LKVLLVDDEATMHELMEIALKGTDYALMSAMNVGAAMKVIASLDSPDIVITDAMMPGDSGFSLIKLLKSNPATSHIPVILWTMLVKENGAVMDSSGKADLTMGKPFDLMNILDTLTSARDMINPNLDIKF